jgi:hypothetical protein
MRLLSAMGSEGYGRLYVFSVGYDHRRGGALRSGASTGRDAVAE